MKNPLKQALYLFDSLLGGYFGQYLEVRSLEFFLAWGAATTRPIIGSPLKALFVWFCRYYTGIVVPTRDSLEGRPKIMPYEDILTLVRRARVSSLHPCSCKSFFLPKDPDMPRDTCMGFQFVEGIEDLSRDGYHDDFPLKEEIVRKLKECADYGLVHQIMTVSRPTGKKGYVLCNCDGEACIPVVLYRKYGIPMVRGSGYVAKVTDEDLCTACGRCIQRCIFDATALREERPVIDPSQCLGCGICISTCPVKIRHLVKA